MSRRSVENGSYTMVDRWANLLGRLLLLHEKLHSGNQVIGSIRFSFWKYGVPLIVGVFYAGDWWGSCKKISHWLLKCCNTPDWNICLFHFVKVFSFGVWIYCHAFLIHTQGLIDDSVEGSNGWCSCSENGFFFLFFSFLEPVNWD